MQNLNKYMDAISSSVLKQGKLGNKYAIAFSSEIHSKIKNIHCCITQAQFQTKISPSGETQSVISCPALMHCLNFGIGAHKRQLLGINVLYLHD